MYRSKRSDDPGQGKLLIDPFLFIEEVSFPVQIERELGFLLGVVLSLT
jgi:hypothetical protein